MKRFFPGCSLALVGLILLLAPPPVQADKVRTDIILLIDVSGSMRLVNVGDRWISFDELKQRIVQFIQKGLPLNSNVYLITFGDDARRHEAVLVKDQQTRDRVCQAIARLEPAGATYMARGIRFALEDLTKLKKQFPNHHRLLFLISDGHNDPPASVPVRERITFDQLRKQVRGELELKPGDDFYLWYAHIGKADATVGGLTRDWKGEPKPVTGDWQIGQLSFNRGLIRLPTQLPGNWAQAFPSREDRDRDPLVFDGYNCDGQELHLGPLAVPGLPPGAKIEVEPRSLKLADGSRSITLTFHGNNVPPGKYAGKLPLRVPRNFIVPSPTFFHFEVEVVEPVVSTQGPELDLGAVAPGRAATGRLRLAPNDAARLLRPSVCFSLEQDGFPEGLSLKGLPDQADLSEAREFELTASLRPGHKARLDARGDNVVKGSIVLRCTNPYVRLAPARVAVRVKLVPLTVVPRERTPVVPLRVGQRTVSMKVAFGGLPSDVKLGLVLGAPEASPGAPPLHLTAARHTIEANRNELTLEARLANTVAPTEEPRKWTYTIPIQSDEPLALFASSSLQLELIPPIKGRVDVIQPEVLRLLVHEIRVVRQSRGNGEVSGELSVPVDTERIPEGTTVRVLLGPPRPLAASAPRLELAPGQGQLSRRKTELILRPSLPADAPSGVWRYSVPLRSEDPRFYFEPRALTLVFDLTKEGKQPAFLTERARVWPFEYRVPVPEGLRRAPATDFTLEYELPDQGWAEGSVEAMPGAQPELLLRSPECLPPLKPMKTGLRLVGFRLLHQGKAVEGGEWSMPVRVVEPHLQGLKFYRLTDEADEPLQASDGRLKLQPPLELAVAPEARPAPGLLPHWKPLERLLLVVRRNRELQGPPDVQTLQTWRAAITAGKSTDEIRIYRLPEDPTKTKFHLPEIGADEREDECHVVAVYRYPDGTEEWASPCLVEMSLPWAPSVWAVGLVLVLLPLGGWLAYATWARSRLPAFSALDIKLRSGQDRLEFEPNKKTPVMGEVSAQARGVWDWVRQLFLPWRQAWVRVVPGRRVITSDAVRQHLRRHLRVLAGPRGLDLVERTPRGARPILGSATHLGSYEERQSQPVALTFHLEEADSRGQVRPWSAMLTVAWSPASKKRGWPTWRALLAGGFVVLAISCLVVAIGWQVYPQALWAGAANVLLAAVTGFADEKHLKRLNGLLRRWKRQPKEAEPHPPSHQSPTQPPHFHDVAAEDRRLRGRREN